MRGAIAAVVIGFVLGVGAIVLGSRWVRAAHPVSHLLTVTGESRLIGEPDTARVMFGVARSAKTVAEGQKRVLEVISRVISALQVAEVKKEDVATSDLNIRQGWDYRKNIPTGYEVSTTLTITVRNVQHVGRVVDTAVANGLNRLEGVSYDVLSPRWRQKALREALANAREKAEAMAAGIGRPLGRVVSVSEQAEWQSSPAEEYYVPQVAAARAMEGEYVPRTRSLPGQRALTVQVEVAYQL